MVLPNRQPLAAYLSPLLCPSRPDKPANMSLDPQGYVVTLQNNIRARPIPWEGAVRAKVITEDANKKIKAIDKVRKEQRKQILDSDPASYASLFLGGSDEPSVLQAVAKRQEFLLYLLVLFEDSIKGR
jgi:V-type H+-transporting ATPase subunit H